MKEPCDFAAASAGSEHPRGATGTRCFDWTVPDEWNIRDAYIVDPDGKRFAEFSETNLHVVNYSIPVDREMSLSQLQSHLHSLPEMPDAVPYVTSYYQRSWGFCVTQRERDQLREGTYRVFIDSDLRPGSLTYADLVIPGATAEQILISTYICHPSMANNELSGPVVATYLAKWISTRERRYTYRFVFVPETIGSITYLSRHLEELKRTVRAGFNVTCVGDERCYSYLPSRAGNTLADQVAKHVLSHRAPNYKAYSFLDRGSRMSVGLLQPVYTLADYPEYHTSKDDLTLVTPNGLKGSFETLKDCLEAIEINRSYRCTYPCEPQMGRRGLYPTLGTRTRSEAVKMRMDILCYCDGHHSLLDIAERLKVSIFEIKPFIDELTAHKLIEPL